jgi:hypothetical protein
VKGLSGAIEPVDEEAPAGDDSGAAEGVEVCCFDNRGMGHSSVLEQKSQYTCVHHVSLFLLSSIAGSMFLTMLFVLLLNSWQDGDHGEGRASAHGSPGMAKSACLRPLHG